ncbi:MAG TPA: hypothetical protein DDW52_07395 [Planctomycetaceae bacterium]|nr:hypothetical protein [Planctomycetaceae bacterium]
MLIDPKSPTPIFRQIATHLRQSIENGVYRPGEMLPSIRALAIDIKVNPNTVQRAYDALEKEGLAESRRGVGVFVADHSTSSAAEKAVEQRLLKCIRQGGRAGMTPESIRLAFESALRQYVSGVAQ